MTNDLETICQEYLSFKFTVISAVDRAPDGHVSVQWRRQDFFFQAFKLPQRVRAEPGRQTVSGAFYTEKNACCDHNNETGIATVNCGIEPPTTF